MSYTTTTRLGLVKPTPGTSEPVNVATQINAAYDKIDDSIGAKPCTSSTRPSTPYDGQFIRETDTGRLYVYSATATAWLQIMGPGSYSAAPGGSTGTIRGVLSSGTPTGNRFIDLRGPGDTNPRYVVDWDGNMQWGNGSTGADTNLYRGGANLLKTDDSFEIGGVGRELRAYRTADQDVTNSTTLVNDDTLFFAVNASEVWAATWVLFYSGTTAQDFKIAITWPSGTCPWGYNAFDQNLAFSSVAFGDGTASGTPFQIGGNGATNVLMAIVNCTAFVGGTGGNIRLQFSQQAASSGTVAKMRKGSNLIAKRMA